MADNSLISVIMATYNSRIDYLNESVQSILTQSHNNIEFIIIDDSTTIETIKFLKNLSEVDSRVIYHHNKKRMGFSGSLNFGLSIASGKFIARMDSDDISEKDRLETQLFFLLNNPDVEILGSAVNKIDSGGREIGIRYYPENENEIKKQIHIWNPILHPTIMYRSSIFDKIGFYDETVDIEDYEYFFRAIKSGLQACNLKEPLLRYRILESSNDHFKRGRHWKNNLELKLKYFSLKYVHYTLVGLILTLAMLVLPKNFQQMTHRIFSNWR